MKKIIMTGFVLAFILATNISQTNAADAKTISVLKMWDDYGNLNQKRPDSLQVKLRKNGEIIQTVDITESENGLKDEHGICYAWKYTYPESITNPQDYTWEIEEVSGYERYHEFTNNDSQKAMTIVIDYQELAVKSSGAVILEKKDNKDTRLDKCQLSLIDDKNNEIVKWESLNADSITVLKNDISAELTENGDLAVTGLDEDRMYVYRETSPKDGYVKANDIKFFLTPETDQYSFNWYTTIEKAAKDASSLTTKNADCYYPDAEAGVFINGDTATILLVKDTIATNTFQLSANCYLDLNDHVLNFADGQSLQYNKKLTILDGTSNFKNTSRALNGYVSSSYRSNGALVIDNVKLNHSVTNTLSDVITIYTTSPKVALQNNSTVKSDVSNGIFQIRIPTETDFSITDSKIETYSKAVRTFSILLSGGGKAKFKNTEAICQFNGGNINTKNRNALFFMAEKKTDVVVDNFFCDILQRCGEQEVTYANGCFTLQNNSTFVADDMTLNLDFANGQTTGIKSTASTVTLGKNVAIDMKVKNGRDYYYKNGGTVPTYYYSCCIAMIGGGSLDLKGGTYKNDLQQDAGKVITLEGTDTNKVSFNIKDADMKLICHEQSKMNALCGISISNSEGKIQSGNIDLDTTDTHRDSADGTQKNSERGVLVASSNVEIDDISVKVLGNKELNKMRSGLEISNDSSARIHGGNYYASPLRFSETDSMDFLGVGIDNYGSLIIDEAVAPVTVEGGNCGISTSAGSDTVINAGTYKSVNHGGIYCATGPAGFCEINGGYFYNNRKEHDDEYLETTEGNLVRSFGAGYFGALLPAEEKGEWSVNIRNAAFENRSGTNGLVQKSNSGYCPPTLNLYNTYIFGGNLDLVVQDNQDVATYNAYVHLYNGTVLAHNTIKDYYNEAHGESHVIDHRTE